MVEVLKRRPELIERPTAAADGIEVVRIIFYVVAIAMVFLTNVVHGFMLKGTKSTDVGTLAGKLATVNMITSALAETPVVLGFVLYVLRGYYTDFYILGFVSLYLMIRHFPYYGQWEKFVKNRLGDSWPASPVSG